MIILVFLLVLTVLQLTSSNIHPYDLPVISPELIARCTAKANKVNETTGKYIPQNVWIAVRNISEARAGHMLGPTGFVARNSNWTVHFCDNENKDAFMERHFSNTSILWCYNQLNPLIGTAKVEIWRLAVLYMYGGMYMDDDANIATPLDKVVQPTDKFIAGKEAYNWTDSCYVDSFALSNHSLNMRFGVENNSKEFFDNKFWFNWALFSMPGNILLLRIMEHIVTLIRAEFLNKSLIKEHHGSLLMCATTHPICLSARELLLENRGEEMGLRVGVGCMIGNQFYEYGGNIKAWNNDWRPDRWTKVMNKQHATYLKSYLPYDTTPLEGKAIQIKGHMESYLVKNGLRHHFVTHKTFTAMGYTLDDLVFVLPHEMHSIKLGTPIP